MLAIDVDGLRFEFPDQWRASRYDEWAFYRRRMNSLRGGLKAVDLLALAPDRTLWLVEVKDYRQHGRTKPSELGAEVASKVIDTLAAIIPARAYADGDEQTFARACSSADRLRVVLHAELRADYPRLHERTSALANLRASLKSLIKPIDAHPLVVDIDTSTRANLPWTVA